MHDCARAFNLAGTADDEIPLFSYRGSMWSARLGVLEGIRNVAEADHPRRTPANSSLLSINNPSVRATPETSGSSRAGIASCGGRAGARAMRCVWAPDARGHRRGVSTPI